MKPEALEAAARVAGAAADRARAEILPRFRHVSTQTKSDGSPVTEADLAAERVIREVLREAYPDFGVIGEEFGEDPAAQRPTWVIDPIDGTIAFSRGIPLFSTLIALVEDGEPVLGLIDLPGLGERTIGWRGGGCRRNGEPLHVSRAADLSRAIVSHGDPCCFERVGHQGAFLRMARELPFLRGYTDAFGHALVLSGAVDAMVDLDLNLWDAAPALALAAEAGGLCRELQHENGKRGLVLGSPALVEQLMRFFDTPG